MLQINPTRTPVKVTACEIIEGNVQLYEPTRAQATALAHARVPSCASPRSSASRSSAAGQKHNRRRHPPLDDAALDCLVLEIGQHRKRALAPLTAEERGTPPC
jgi:hypothetical protein